MNSFSILLLLGIGTLVAFLLLVAEVRYFMRYKEFQTVREKMNHADSWKEFVFWHLQLLRFGSMSDVLWFCGSVRIH